VLHRHAQRHFTGTAGEYSRSIFRHVLATGAPAHIENALDDDRFRHRQSIQNLRLVSILCLPIRVGGEIAALLYLEHGTPGHFQQSHARLLASLLEISGPALEAMQAGRQVLRESEELQATAGRVRQEVEEARTLLSHDWPFGRFVGRSPVVRLLEEEVRKAAGSEFPVLITGETGTGKSILARVVHHGGPRSRQAFVTVFCPTLERGLVEAELFGHRRGAFTGADKDRPGKVPAAEGGSLFLDEISSLPPEIQAKLLRLLQERAYEPLGEARERTADVRFIAATNRDLEEQVRSGAFRRDLHERLNFAPIRIPALRERTEDIPLLLRHFLDRHDHGRWVEVEPRASAYLQDLDFAWPGNVRHIEQLAARIIMEGLERPVTPADVARLLGSAPVAASVAGDRNTDPPAAGGGAALDAGLPALMQEAERRWLQTALQAHPGLTRAELAAKLKISESALYKKLRAYDLP
jgi:transcriptional regulator with GAF, ATPase, and Fis domain